MPRVFVPVSDFTPDTPRHVVATGALRVAKNVLPFGGGLRSIRQLSLYAATGETDDPITGLYAHLYQEDRSDQTAYAISDDSNSGNWQTEDGDETDLYTSIDETEPDDNDFIIVGGAPSTATCKLKLTSLAAAALTSGHAVTFRYLIADSTGSWTLTVKLVEGASTVIKSHSETGSADAAISEVTFTLSSGEAGTITDYTDLYIQLEASVTGSSQTDSPASDDYNSGWTTNSGGSSNIYQAIDESSYSDADYVQSPVMAAGESKTYRTKLSKPDRPYENTGITVDYRYYALNAGVNLTVYLKSGTTVIHTDTLTNIATSVTAATMTVTAAEAADIDWTEDLYLEFVSSYPSSVASTQFQEFYPDSLVSEDDDGADMTKWAGTAASFWASLASGTGEFVYSNGTEATTFEVGYPAFVDPRVSTAGEFTINFYVRELGSASGYGLYFKMKAGGTTIVDSGVTIAGSSPNLVTHTLSSSQITNLLTYGLVSLSLFFDTPTTNLLTVFYANIKIPQPRRAIVTYVKLNTPSAARAEVSWLKFVCPGSVTYYTTDILQVYAGTESKLYEVATGGFTDRSKSGGYATGSAAPTAWQFCSWGNEVIATNFVDDIQIGTPGSDFADMITAPSPAPKCRYVAVIRDVVVLADINLTGHTGDEVWWSGANASDRFDPGYNIAGYQQLKLTKGQITGIVGGQYGIIFKRNSVIRMSYIGYPGYWRWDVLSDAVGCAYPNSIVKYNEDIYFMSNHGLYVVRNGTTIEPVGEGKVWRFLFDREASDYAIKAVSSGDPRTHQLLVNGAAISSTPALMWSIRKGDDDEYRASMLFMFNPIEDRFTFGQYDGLDISTVCSMNTTSDDLAPVTKGMLVATYDGADIQVKRFVSAYSYDLELRTGLFQIDKDIGSVQIMGIRPLYDLSVGNINPDITVELLASDDEDIATSLKYGSPTGRDERTSGEITYDQRTQNGFYPVTMRGQYFQIVLRISNMNHDDIHHVVGFTVSYANESVAEGWMV